MRLPPFDLAQPEDLGAAVRLLAANGPAARVMAGGTDLLLMLKQRNRTPRLLVSLERVSEHGGIEYDTQQGLRIGALAKLSQVAASPLVRKHYPALAQAAAVVGSPQVRNRGTLGGNLCLDKRCWFFNQSETWRGAWGVCLRAGGETCSVVKGATLCHSLVTADTATALLALQAELLVVGPAGERCLPLTEFFAGLGDDANVLGPAELLAEVRVPPPSPGTCSAYARHALRGAIDYPIAQVAIALQIEGELCRWARIVMGALAPNPTRATKAEALLAGQALTPELMYAAAEAAVRQVKLVPYIGRTPEYKRLVARGLLQATLLQVAGLDAAKHN